MDSPMKIERGLSKIKLSRRRRRMTATSILFFFSFTITVDGDTRPMLIITFLRDRINPCHFSQALHFFSDVSALL